VETEPLLAALYAYMYYGTGLWGKLAEARRLLEEALPDDKLHQVKESARITYERHVKPLALQPSRSSVEDTLPLFIMYAHNAAENASILQGETRRRLVDTVYGELRWALRREPQGSPVVRGLEALRRLDLVGGGEPGARYSLALAVAVVAEAYASGRPVVRLSLAPLYALARFSLAALEV